MSGKKNNNKDEAGSEATEASSTSPVEVHLLFPRHLAFIRNVVEVACIFGIDSIIIGKDLIRGMDNHQSVAIISPCTEQMPFPRIHIDRLSLLKRKLDIAEDLDDLVVTFWVRPVPPDHRTSDKVVIKG